MLGRTKFNKKKNNRKRYIYDKSKTEKLDSTKYDNTKAYWRLLKQAANKIMKHSINSKQFADCFKTINDPRDRCFQIYDDILFFNERYVREEFQIMFDEGLKLKWADGQSQIKLCWVIENAGLVTFSRTSFILSSYVLFIKILEKTCIKRSYWQISNMPKFLYLFSSENWNIIKNFSILIEKAFKIRDQSGVI